MLYIVGVNIDSRKASRWVGSGKLQRIHSGIYASTDEGNVEDLVRRNAARIAGKVFDTPVYLSHGSALTMGVAADGDVHVSGIGRKGQYKTTIAGVNFIIRPAPVMPDFDAAVIEDDLGKTPIKVSTALQTLVDMADLRLGPPESLLDKVLAKYGTLNGAVRAVEMLAGRQHIDPSKALYALRLRETSNTNPVIGTSRGSLVVAWYNHPVGQLAHDGLMWTWLPGESWALPFPRSGGSTLPAFFENLMPEGWLRDVTHKDEVMAVFSSRRLLSNIGVAPTLKQIRENAPDLLLSRLANHDPRNIQLLGMMDRGQADIMQDLADLWQDQRMPKLSGAQVKVPCTLNSDGVVVPAVASPFSHILKVGGREDNRALSALEWIGLQVAAAAGAKVPANMMVATVSAERGEDLCRGPSLLVERFDVPTSKEDTRLYLAEDFCSLMQLRPSQKTGSTFEHVAQTLRRISTDADRDMEELFRRAVLTWVVGDGDCHLKNLSILKSVRMAEFRGGGDEFDEVRLSPNYDMVTTVALPSLERDTLSLSINGKFDGLTVDDFRQFANNIGVGVRVGDLIIQEVCQAAATRALQIAAEMPDLITRDKRVHDTALKAISIIVDRARSLGAEFDLGWTPELDREVADAVAEQQRIDITPLPKEELGLVPAAGEAMKPEPMTVRRNVISFGPINMGKPVQMSDYQLRPSPQPVAAPEEEAELPVPSPM